MNSTMEAAVSKIKLELRKLLNNKSILAFCDLRMKQKINLILCIYFVIFLRPKEYNIIPVHISS